jgi:hypothetical protein
MKKLHQLFDVTDGLPLGELLGFGNGDPAICWYPSAGHDFRHLVYLEHERFRKPDHSQPLIFVFSDMLLRREALHAENPELPFRSGDILAVGSAEPSRRDADGGHELRIGRIERLRLKHDFYDPSTDVWVLDTDAFTRNVYFIQFEMTSVVGGRRIALTIPGIYFTYENLNMLVDFFLANQLRVPLLIHICDGGGSFGGSAVPMNFIYQAYRQLGLARVITDKSINAFTSEPYQDNKLLTARLKLRKYPSIRPADFTLVDTRGGDFMGLWKERGIDPSVYGWGEFFAPYGNYYDWWLA